MKLKVAQAHIDKAEALISRDSKGLAMKENLHAFCPIAIAVNEALNQPIQTYCVSDSDIFELKTLKVIGNGSTRMRGFILKFDKGKEVKPTNFNITLDRRV